MLGVNHWTGLLLTTLSAILLVVFGVIYVIPYHYTKNHLPSHCIVTSVNITNKHAPCDCLSNGRIACASTIPCLRITVDYCFSDRNEFLAVNWTRDATAILLDNYQSLTLQSQKSDDSMCSVFMCEEDFAINHAKVEMFKSVYGFIGKMIPCHYDPNDVNVAFTKSVSREIVLSTMLLGSIAFACGVGLFIFANCYCNGKSAKVAPDSSQENLREDNDDEFDVKEKLFDHRIRPADK